MERNANRNCSRLVETKKKGAEETVNALISCSPEGPMGRVNGGWVFFVQEHGPLLFSVYSSIELQAVLRPIQTPIIASLLSLQGRSPINISNV